LVLLEPLKAGLRLWSECRVQGQRVADRAELNEGDRELVIRAAKLQGLPNDLPTLSGESFDEVKGIVSLVGNADEDCKALYAG
jgi:hypothetical protein